MIPWPITTESELFALNNYIDPDVFSCKLLSNYLILSVYFSFTCLCCLGHLLSLLSWSFVVFVVLVICCLCCLVHLCNHHSRALNYRNEASQLVLSQFSERKPRQSVTNSLYNNRSFRCNLVIFIFISNILLLLFQQTSIVNTHFTE